MFLEKAATESKKINADDIVAKRLFYNSPILKSYSQKRSWNIYSRQNLCISKRTPNSPRPWTIFARSGDIKTMSPHSKRIQRKYRESWQKTGMLLVKIWRAKSHLWTLEKEKRTQQQVSKPNQNQLLWSSKRWHPVGIRPIVFYNMYKNQEYAHPLYKINLILFVLLRVLQITWKEYHLTLVAWRSIWFQCWKRWFRDYQVLTGSKNYMKIL